MSVVGVPVGGLKTVGQIVATNTFAWNEFIQSWKRGDFKNKN